jgi:pimeloyl-ACP methyl ester carboxylesterase
MAGRTQRVPVGDITMSYADWGSGRPLVLLHGGLSTGREWEPLAARLSSRYRVIAPDARGHGLSTRTDQNLAYGLLADDVAAFIRVLELRDPVVGGWSDGGQVTLELAVRHPALAAALIVGGALPDYVGSGLRERSRALLEAPDEAEDEGAEMRAAHADWAGLFELTKRMWLDYEGISATDVSEIAAPVLVLAADHDELVDVEQSVSLYRSLTNAELAVCPATTHEAVAGEGRAGIVASAIDDFCRRHGRP